MNGGPAHADQQFIEPSRRDGPRVVHVYVVNIIVISAGAHAAGGVDGIGKISAFNGGVLPAFRVAHREAVFVGEVLVDFDGVGIAASNVRIGGGEVGCVRVKGIIVVGGKSSQGFQNARRLVKWTWNLIVGERLALEGRRVRGLRIVNDDWRISRRSAIRSGWVAWNTGVNGVA